MSRRKISRRPGNAKLVLALLGVVSLIAGVGFAIAQTVRSPAPSAGDPLAANSPFSRKLSIRVTPAEQSVASGASAVYRIQVRNRGGRRVGLGVLGALPAGVAASFDRTSFSAKRRGASGSTLTLDAPSGGHRLKLIARSGRRRAIAPVNLVVRAQQPTNFSISGDLSGVLEPGLTVPLDLVLTNPGPVGLTVSSLEVGVAGVDAPLADATYPCTVEDFSVTQFSGVYGFTLPASSTSSLSGLGLPPEEWPGVTMVNRPVNQNGCKGATVEFDFTGTAGATS